MPASNPSTLVAAAAGFVFGLFGGALGAWFVGAQMQAPPQRSSESDAHLGAADLELTNALGDLVRELAALRELRATSADELRATDDARPPRTETAPNDVERIVTALDAFAKSLGDASVLSGTRRSSTPLVVAGRRRNEGALLQVARAEIAARSRQLRFSTYQQVLDRFGPPDDVHQDGSWFYEVPPNDELTFKWYDGMLVNIY